MIYVNKIFKKTKSAYRMKFFFLVFLIIIARDIASGYGPLTDLFEIGFITIALLIFP